MLREVIDVYSEKNDVRGVIKDYGVVAKLFFSYGGRDIEMGINRNPLRKDSFEAMGQRIIDAYIANLDPGKRDIRLYDWYIDEHDGENGTVLIGHGVVTGHPRIMDATGMHTSAIQAVFADFDKGEINVTTLNNVYHLPMEQCRWKAQDKAPHLIPDYELMKERYQGKIIYPTIEPGKVLLVLSNSSRYYFHSLHYVPEGSKDGKPEEYHGYAHVGTFQDSYLISTDDYEIDLRYFPHYQNIEFYSEITADRPLFLENVGDAVLYAKTSVGIIRLDPGDRKEVKKENADTDPPVLPGGDLYPAGIV